MIPITGDCRAAVCARSYFFSRDTGASTAFLRTLAMPFWQDFMVLYPSLLATIWPFFAFRRKRNSPPLSV